MNSPEIIHLGQLVYSTQGRDRGQAYLVYKLLDPIHYVLLIDGKTRTVKNPKKKNIRHIMITSWISEEIVESLAQNASIKNEMVQSSLAKCIKMVKEGSLLE